jgi:hypothetical protein
MATPEPQEGMKNWKEKTGQDYPFKGWWSKPESLDLNVFDIKPFDGVLNLLKTEKKSPDTYVIILTSRMEKLRPQVQTILDVNNIHVDKLDMKTTEKKKGEKILDYIQEFPDLEEIDVYDDRESDIASYKEIQSVVSENIKFNIFLADRGHLQLVEPKNKLIDVINEEILNLLKT